MRRIKTSIGLAFVFVLMLVLVLVLITEYSGQLLSARDGGQPAEDETRGRKRSAVACGMVGLSWTILGFLGLFWARAWVAIDTYVGGPQAVVPRWQQCACEPRGMSHEADVAA